MVALKFCTGKEPKNIPKDRLESITTPNGKAICNRILFYNIIACLGVAILGCIWIFTSVKLSVAVKAGWPRDDEGNLVMTFDVISRSIWCILFWNSLCLGAIFGFLTCIQDLKKNEASKAEEGNKIPTV